MTRAACRGVALDVGFDDFFPSEKHPGRNGHSNQAKEKYCSICPVREECLDYAISNAIHDGLWGGVFMHDRKIIGRDNNKDFENLVSELEPSFRGMIEQLEVEMQDL